MFKKTSAVLLTMIGLSAAACWFSEENFNLAYIAAVNDYTTFSPGTIWNGGAINTPDGGTVSLPATMWVVLSPRLGGGPITTTILQYKKLPAGEWVTIKTLSDLSWTVNFTAQIRLFGPNVLDPPDVVANDEILVRIYFTDGLFENAPLENDTDENGTNGWADQWVVRLVISPNRRPQ